MKENAIEYYGKTVKGYTGYDCESSQYEWQIFYSDGKNVYITTKDYIKASDCPEKDGEKVFIGSTYEVVLSNIYKKYTGYSDLINNPIAVKLLSYLKSDYAKDNINTNMCITAYLLDNSIWDTKFKGNNAEYAIGATTIDMYKGSYNDTHPNKQIVTKPDIYGDKIGWQNDNIFHSDVLTETGIIGQFNNLYVIPTYGKARYQWIASPSAYNDNWIYYVAYTGDIYLYGNHGGDFGLRPVVCLSSDVGLDKIEDGDTFYFKIAD